MGSVTLKDVTYRWPKAKADILDITAWSLNCESVFLFGPSGSGKSTLIGLLAGVLTPSSGEIKINNQRLDALSKSERDRFRANNIGLVFQQFNLIPYLSVEENVLLPLRFAAQRAAAIGSPRNQKKAALELLQGLGLGTDCARNPAGELSVGQQQRVAIARALIGAPSIIIADEPTSALDADARDGFMELLFREVKKIQSTLIFVSHDRSLAKWFNKELSISSLSCSGGGAAASPNLQSVSGCNG